jgi:hypothetical protein
MYKRDRRSVQRVFEQYERIVCISRLELNADKTEILALYANESLTYNIKYFGQNFKIKPVKYLKICGL